MFVIVGSPFSFSQRLQTSGPTFYNQAYRSSVAHLTKYYSMNNFKWWSTSYTWQLKTLAIFLLRPPDHLKGELG